MKILMVCLGNICRSPLAEGVLKNKIAEAGLSWGVESAGTNHYETGCPPHQLSQKIATANGIDISQHKCRQFTKGDMAEFDLIYVMDMNNFKDVKAIAGSNWDAGKVDLLLNELFPSENRPIPDPYYLDEPAYKHVFSLVDRACTALITKYTLVHQQASDAASV